MATHAARAKARRSLVIISTVVLGMCAFPAMASADPSAHRADRETAVAGVQPAAPPAAPPSTADEAKQAWIDAALQSEALGEKVLDAQAAVQAARKRASAASAALGAAQAQVKLKQVAVDAAQTTLAGLQAKVDAFANASFRGARFGQLTILLTAQSPDDYLDEVSSLDQVAADVQRTLDDAVAAKRAAQAVQDQARQAADQALQAKQQADAATTAAVRARQDLDAKRAELTEQTHTYQLAYARLSAADRSSAVAQLQASTYAANTSAEALARQQVQAAQRGAAGLMGTGGVVGTGPDFAARAAAAAPSVQAGIAVEAALSRQGLPYVWSAVGPDAFDCSGLMVWAWSQAGVTLPRTSSEQSTLTAVPLDQLRPGDLVTYYTPVSHVAMYVGDGLVVEASMPGVPIKVVNLFAAGPDPTGHRVTP